MPKSYWLHQSAARRSLGAAFALAFAAVVVLLLWPPAPRIPVAQELESFDAFFTAIDPECSAILSRPGDFVGTPKQIDDCSDKQANQRKGYRDLAQSIRSANAAEDAAWLSYLQTRAAIVGAALVLLTLGATAWTAWAAADAAKIAEKAAGASIKAAEAAVAEAAHTAERQLRAYISIGLQEKGKVVLNTSRIEIDFAIRNRGQTPAYALFHWNRVEIREFPLKGRLNRDKSTPLRFAKVDILPGDDPYGITAYYRDGIGVDDMIALQRQVKRVYIFGNIYYRDAFKRRRYMRYCYTLRVEPGGIVPAPELYYDYNKSN